MAAEDVKASVERFLAMAPRRNELSDLAKVEVVNPSSVRMTLKQVNAAFLAAIANPICQLAILPKEAVEGRPINKASIWGMPQPSPRCGEMKQSKVWWNRYT